MSLLSNALWHRTTYIVEDPFARARMYRQSLGTWHRDVIGAGTVAPIRTEHSPEEGACPRVRPLRRECHVRCNERYSSSSLEVLAPLRTKNASNKAREQNQMRRSETEISRTFFPVTSLSVEFSRLRRRRSRKVPCLPNFSFSQGAASVPKLARNIARRNTFTGRSRRSSRVRRNNQMLGDLWDVRAVGWKDWRRE